MINSIDVIYEDNHLLIINKKGGVLVQADKTEDISLIDLAKEYLKKKYNKPGNIFCGVIHRIDRPVSGIVLLAKTSKALERMNALFRERKIQKTYWALVQKKPLELEKKLIHWLKKDPTKNKVSIYTHSKPETQQAELDYKLIKSIKDLFLLEIKPITGRPHQIRAQLSFIGCPIKGDVKYGFPTPNSDQCINLHARKIEFIHPIKNTLISITADLPAQATWYGLEELNKI